MSVGSCDCALRSSVRRVVALENSVVRAIPNDLERTCGVSRGDEEQYREQGQEDGPSHWPFHASSPHLAAPAAFSARDMPVAQASYV